MHLQQTKQQSRKSGGPQYWLQEIPDAIMNHLRAERAVPVALVTPYGATPSDFRALWRDAKLTHDLKIVKANRQHEAIQKAGARGSIGEEIRQWYRLKPGDFYRINIEMQVLDDKFYLTPVGYNYKEGAPIRPIPRPEFPLSYNNRRQSDLWKRQLAHVQKAHPEMWRWSIGEICRVAQAHAQDSELRYVREEDLLRASGPLNVLGVELGPYRGKGFDCQGVFQFLNYAPYSVPIEIKKASSGFEYQQRKYPPEELSRAVILCMRNDLVNVPPNVDIIQLETLCSIRDR
jgi:hypothetical protein